MFCFQCQETAKNTGCTVRGVCGKDDQTANLQDLLIYILKGIAVYGEKAEELGVSLKGPGLFTARALFATITNANFDEQRIVELIKKALEVRDELKEQFLAAYREKSGADFSEELPDAATWTSDDLDEFRLRQSFECGALHQSYIVSQRRFLQFFFPESRERLLLSFLSVGAPTVLLHAGQCHSSTGGSRPNCCTEWNRARS